MVRYLSLLLLLFTILSCSRGPNEKTIRDKIHLKYILANFRQDFFKISKISLEKTEESKEEFLGYKIENTKMTVHASFESLADLVCNPISNEMDLPNCQLVTELKKNHEHKVALLSNLKNKNDRSSCPPFSLACQGVPYTNQKIQNLIHKENQEYEKSVSGEKILRKGTLFLVKNITMHFSCESNCSDRNQWK